MPVLGSAAELLSEYGFLVEFGIAEPVLRQTCDEGAARGIAPHLLLIHAGVIAPRRYIEVLESRLAPTAGRSPSGITEIVDAMSASPRGVASAVAEVRARGNVAMLLMPQHIDLSEPPETRVWRADEAANGLKRRHPQMSAGSPFATWQLVAVPVLPGFVIGGMLISPATTLVLLGLIVTLPFLLIVGLRLLALLLVLRPAPPRPVQLPADAELPVYSVIVPLFREAEVVPDLVAALGRLDYPAAKLDILIVTESIDQDTQAALKVQPLPPHMRVLVVPDLAPRTKPKALNFALRMSRGTYVVIYDAEDEPEPDQLRRAFALFQDGPKNLMCVQGRLAMRHPAPGWIASQFILEYAALFEGLLPVLSRLRLPVPLGGTSNHFPRAVLDRLGGWDAWNVTEDADLGIRIARCGGSVAVLDSVTFEEPPDRFRVWLPQRTRWLKGFMQTWLVHMRRPALLWRELGLAGFVGFNAFLGGVLLSALVHPIFLALVVAGALSGDLMALTDTALGQAVLWLAAFNLVGGYASGMAIAGLAVARRGQLRLLAHLPLMPIYWLLISAAAYRAALQLVTKPYLWEKTPHTARRTVSADAGAQRSRAGKKSAGSA